MSTVAGEPTARRGGRSPHQLAFAWGFAEATLFFIVPDVILTRLALTDLRAAFIACGWALLGALLGGALLWIVAQSHATTALRLFEYLPGINRELIQTTGRALADEGWYSLFAGAVWGQPYKLFAVHAGAQGMPLAVFLAASAGARLMRFVLALMVTWLANRALQRYPLRLRLRLHLWFWLVSYAIYFVVMR